MINEWSLSNKNVKIFICLPLGYLSPWRRLKIKDIRSSMITRFDEIFYDKHFLSYIDFLFWLMFAPRYVVTRDLYVIEDWMSQNENELEFLSSSIRTFVQINYYGIRLSDLESVCECLLFYIEDCKEQSENGKYNITVFSIYLL